MRVKKISIISIGFLLCFLTNFTSSLLNENLIDSYLKEKSIRVATLYGCFSRKDQFELFKLYSQKEVFMNIVHIDEMKSEEIVNFHPIGSILDADCQNVGIFLTEAERMNNNMFGRRYKWLIISHTSNITEKFTQMMLNIDADIHVAFPENMTGLDRWSILDIYNPSFERGGYLRVEKIGYFDRNRGYQAKYMMPKYIKRRNLSDVLLRTQIVLPEPFNVSLKTYLNSNDRPDINTFNRFHQRVVDNCKRFYNYSVDIKLVKSWGYKNDDGTFDGMVGALQRKYIDFGSSPLFVRADRGRLIDYGRNTWILRAAFLFRNQRTVTPGKTFLDPLSFSIWIAIIICGILSIIVLKFLLHYDEDLEGSHTWSSIVLFTISAFCQQGTMKLSDSTHARIVMVFVYLLALFMYQCYTASIVAHLLMVPNATITTVEGIVKSSMRAGCQDILYEKDYLKYTNDKWAKELLNKKLYNKDGTTNFLSPEEGLRNVDIGNYAFNVELATAYPIIEKTFAERSVCELREVQMLSTQPMHANYQKNSPLRDMMDVCLQRVAEVGILHKERLLWHPRKPHCIRSTRSIIFNVGLEEFYPALGILGLGMLLSLLILLIEIIVAYRNNYRSKKDGPSAIQEFVH